MDKIDALYQRAVEIAAKAHEGQKDKGGNPYISHPLAVAQSVDTTELKIVAVLHDVLEDSSITAQDLLAEGFSQDLVEAVCVLTHNKSDPLSYEDYICLVRQNPIARVVKIADIHHNLDLSRIPAPSECDYRRCEKYKRALDYLTGETDPGAAADSD